MEEKLVNDEYEYGELCVEILKNWNSPITSFVHQNPFSMNHHQLNPSYDIQREATLYSPHLSIQDTQPLYCMSNSKTEGEGSTELMDHKDDKTVQAAVKTTSYEAEEGNEVISVAPSYMVKENNDDFTIILNNVSTNNETRIEKLRSGHEILKCDFRINRCIPATSDYAVPADIRSYACGSAAKLKFVLPSNKTICDINIDHIDEKLWRKPGVDTSDFFNYGLDEKQWKDYCKLMRLQVQAKRSGQRAMSAYKHRQSHKEGDADKVKLDRAIDECLKFTYSKDLSLYDSHVIIEIAMRESVYERAQPLSERDNTPHINYKMIKGENILPFPMDSYSAKRREYSVINLDRAIDEGHNYSDLKNQSLYDSHVIIEIAMHDPIYEKTQPTSDIDSTSRIIPRVIRGDNIMPFPMDSFSAENRYKRVEKRAERGNHKRFQKRRKCWSFSQQKQNRIVFNHRNHHELDVTLAKSSFLSNPEIDLEVGNLMEKYLRDPERLKRRRERYKLPPPNESIILQQDMSNTDPDVTDQRPTRRRKWTSS